MKIVTAPFQQQLCCFLLVNVGHVKAGSIIQCAAAVVFPLQISTRTLKALNTIQYKLPSFGLWKHFTKE